MHDPMVEFDIKDAQEAKDEENERIGRMGPKEFAAWLAEHCQHNLVDDAEHFAQAEIGGLPLF